MFLRKETEAMSDKIIELKEAQKKVRAICLNGAGNCVSLISSAVRSYADEYWENFSNPAAHFLQECITCLAAQTDIFSAQQKIEYILQHFGDG